MGQADDVERVAAGCRAQPHSLYKRRVAEQGGDAGGGSTLGTQSTFAQMGHIDSPGRSRLNRDIHFEKSPYHQSCCPALLAVLMEAAATASCGCARDKRPHRLRVEIPPNPRPNSGWGCSPCRPVFHLADVTDDARRPNYGPLYQSYHAAWRY